MTRFLPRPVRPEVPSRGELCSILLAALLACVVLVFAFRVTATARTPVRDEESAYRSEGPVLVAAPVHERAGTVVVRPEAPRAAHRHRHAHAAAPRP